LSRRLNAAMMDQSLRALAQWDRQGMVIPTVSVNFSKDELRDPHLVSRLKWDLDRFDLTPDRLGIEILESVVVDAPGDIVARNVAELGKLGCRIDLDDFGTGHASIAWQMPALDERGLAFPAKPLDLSAPVLLNRR